MAGSATAGSAIISFGRDVNGETGSANQPILTLAAPIRSVGAGLFHSYAVTESGDLWTWGAGSGGQLGIPRGEGIATFGESSCAHVGSPTKVKIGPSGTAALRAAAGRNHTVAVTNDGSMFSWGRAVSGQLGHGEAAGAGATRRVIDADLVEPKKVQPVNSAPELPKFASVDCGEHFTAAISHGGILYTWGCEHNGQLGRPPASCICIAMF